MMKTATILYTITGTTRTVNSESMRRRRRQKKGERIDAMGIRKDASSQRKARQGTARQGKARQGKARQRTLNEVRVGERLWVQPLIDPRPYCECTPAIAAFWAAVAARLWARAVHRITAVIVVQNLSDRVPHGPARPTPLQYSHGCT